MKKQHLKELKRIQESIPEKMKSRLLIKRSVAPTVKKVVNLALKDKDITDKQKERLQHLKDTGLFDKKEEVVNKTAQKEIDKYLNEEIAKSIAAGRLPEPKDNSLFNKYLKKCKKNM